MDNLKDKILDAVIRSAKEMMKDPSLADQIDHKTVLVEIGIDSLSLLMLFVKLEKELKFSLIELGPIDREIKVIDDVAELLKEKIGHKIQQHEHEHV